MNLDFVEFEWDEYNESKIWNKHRVTADETEDCFFNTHVLKKKPSSSDRYYLYGKTNGGRYLFIVFQYKKDIKFIRPISARNMTSGEFSVYGRSLK